MLPLTVSHMQITYENIVAKGEIAHDEQFLLLPQCFQLFSRVSLIICFKSRPLLSWFLFQGCFEKFRTNSFLNIYVYLI